MIADLPDGTDKVIEGAAITSDNESSADSDRGMVDRFRDSREQLSSQAGERARGFVTQGLERTSEALANVSKMIGDTAAGIDERLGSEYGEYARRAAGSIENVANQIASKDPDELIDDTAAGIDERLGSEYGEYARRAAGSIENVANQIASKDPDELIDDTRNFVRNSPGIALAGAAVVGFVVARLLKTGLASDDEGDND